ncbi:MAG: cupin [Frankiales bacterium]|nr:cupin [Frankiales bacterium]
MSLDTTCSVVALDNARTVTTPAAVMRTYAAPSGPATASVAVWRTEMSPDATGPLHVVSEDQVMVVIDGSLSVELADSSEGLGAGSAVVLPAGIPRRVTAGPDGAVVVVASRPGATARVGDGDPVVVPWAS